MLRLKEGGPIYSIEMRRFRVSKSKAAAEAFGDCRHCQQTLSIPDLMVET